MVAEKLLCPVTRELTLQFAANCAGDSLKSLCLPICLPSLSLITQRMNATANTSAVRFGVSKPPVFGGHSTAPTASTPSGNPFASGATAAWRGNAPLATPFSSNSNPFAQSSAQANAAGVSGGAFGVLGSSTGSFGASPFGVRQPFPSAVSSFGRLNVNFGSIDGFAHNANTDVGVNTASGATAAPGQATTGWFPLGEVSSTTPKPAQMSAFDAPLADQSRPVEQTASVNPFLGSAGSRDEVGPSNPFATFRTTNRNVTTDASVFPFAPKLLAPAATTNPFAVGNGAGIATGFVQKRAFLTHRDGRTPPRTNQNTIEGGGFDPFGLHSDIAMVTPRPFAPDWQFSADPNSILIPNTGIHLSSSPGFRFTVTPSWPLTVEKAHQQQTQQPKVFSSCFAFPKLASDAWPGAKKEEASRFTFKCGSDWNTTPTSNAGAAPPTGFDVKLNSAAATPSTEQEPKSLVALPNVNPYGVGSFGFSRLEVAVQAALNFEHVVSERSSNFFLSSKPKPKAPVSHVNLGLPTRPINCYQFKTSRRLIGERNSLRIASIRRAVSVRSARRGDVSNGGEQRASEAQSEFTFKSSLFQELDSKKDVESTSESCDKTKEDTQEDESVHLEPTLPEYEVGDNLPLLVSPACPVLSNPQISTVPELSQLQRMSSEDLAQVDGFTIRSAEFGEIEWPELTDVRHLNLDEILQFSESEVVVYPDECPNKPEVGQGLNKRAILRLSHIYPSETNRRSENEAAATTAFVERLKKRTADLRALFLGYEAEGGVWTFEVQHF